MLPKQISEHKLVAFLYTIVEGIATRPALGCIFKHKQRDQA